MAAIVIVARVAFALDFAVALGAWVLGACAWPIAGAVASVSLTGFMCTWGEPLGEAVPASRPSCRAAGPRASRYW